MNALAQRIHRFGDPSVIELESIELPRPGPGEALIKVIAAGVGPWDAWIRAGKSALPQPLPLTIGADIAGVVLLTSTDAEHVNAGVAIYGVTNGRFVGGYATHAIVDVHRIARKPPGLAFIDAAGLPVVAVTAWKMLFERGKLRAGQRVVVHGASGSVGSLAVQMAHDAGAFVIALGASEDAALLSAIGADRVLDYDRPFEDRIEPVDLVLDTIGGEIQERSFATLKDGGALISIVNPPDPERARASGVRAEFFVVDITTQDIERISQLVTNGVVTATVGTVLPLADARQAHVLIEARSKPRGKIILSMEP